MRCKEKIGFLMLRRCENVAETQCCSCRKNLCSEHKYALSSEQALLLPSQPTGSLAIVCLECFRKLSPQREASKRPMDQQEVPGQPQGLQGQRTANSTDPADPYYTYPYYGTYHPYVWGTDFSDHDRRVFDNQGVGTGDDGVESPLDS